jgi:hypothetical protein
MFAFSNDPALDFVFVSPAHVWVQFCTCRTQQCVRTGNQGIVLAYRQIVVLLLFERGLLYSNLLV